MSDLSLFIMGLIFSTSAFAKLPISYQEVSYSCKMDCGKLGFAKTCRGLEVAGKLIKDINGNFSGYHDSFTFFPNDFEYHNAALCKADYTADLIPVDSNSMKISFSMATYNTPQTCSDGMKIDNQFDDTIRSFSIYLELQNENKGNFTFKSLVKVPTTTIGPSQPSSPVCEVTFN